MASSAASQAAPGNPGPAATFQPPQQQPQEEKTPAPRQQKSQQHTFELVGEVVERRRAGVSGSNALTSTSTSTAGGFPAATHRRQSKVRSLFLLFYAPRLSSDGSLSKKGSIDRSIEATHAKILHMK